MVTSFIIRVVVIAVAVLVLSNVLPGVRLKSFGTALIVGAVYALLNSLLFPLLAFISFIPLILSLGLFGLVINTFLLWVTDKAIEDFEIESLGATFLMACGITLSTVALGAVT